RNSDVTFIFDDASQIYAHKAIIAPRCQFFWAQFTGKFEGNSQKKQFPIKSTSFGVMYKMLEFLYCTSPEASQLVSIPLEIALDVLVCANFYGVEDLKKTCERILMVQF